MDKNREHIDQNSLPNDHEKLFEKLEVSFSDTKEDIWNQLEEKIDCEPKPSHVIQFNWKIVTSIAASLLVLVTLFATLYTQTITTENAQHLVHQLPDGSQIELNAQTSISYKPYIWRFSRKVSLNGEAFFSVQKGEKFQVLSENGTTEVLGTSFNIYARASHYRVFCKTGKVKVSNDVSHQIIIPNQSAVVNHSTIEKREDVESNVLFWQQNILLFKSESIGEVITELERQFDVKIKLDQNLSSKYSGKFEKNKGVDSILNMMALSLNLKVKRVDHQNYTISSNQ